AWENREVGGGTPELLVFRCGHGDLLVALLGAAFTKDRHFLLEVEDLGELVDPFVDLPEERLPPADLACLPIALINWLRHRTLRPGIRCPDPRVRHPPLLGWAAHPLPGRASTRERHAGAGTKNHRSGAIPARLGRR